MPKSHWTLLVQDVDKWDRDVGALLAHVDFLPRWRIDDIMISYAVGRFGWRSNVDRDVFLIQGWDNAAGRSMSNRMHRENPARCRTEATQAVHALA